MKDLIISQKQFEESRERELRKEEIRRNYQKELDKKDRIITILGFLGIALALIVMLHISGDMGKDAYNNCINNGYSADYCAKNS